ncbi:MAG TPA: hypothetical protein VM870_06890, partial [Pyrinomonadaceae bacterium]|nr:hypothetical protein [Pyrinomonadaceae bacterium]
RPLPLDDAASKKGQDGEDEKLALAHAPFLYARANSIDRFTDLPLMIYYEIERDKEKDAADELIVRYTTIFTNEDGGTPTAALMARWGRTTDIEWTYEARFRRGVIVAETYQGVAHETKTYAGERVAGAHPILAVASDNNNFSELACSAVRFAPLPVRARLERATRESMMDGLMYRVMVEELTREKRIGGSGSANVIGDPREYLYLEAYGEQRGAALAFEVNDGGTSPVIRSDLGDARLRIERSGYFQTTLRRPIAASVNLVARCYATNEEAAQRSCQKVRLGKVFILDQNFAPRALSFTPRAGEQPSLAPGETITYTLTQQ